MYGVKKTLKPRAEAFLLMTIILSVFVCLVVSIIISVPLWNNMALNSFSEQLFDCNLPVGARLVEKHAICGKLNGNGNGMDFLACILIESDKTTDEVERHFEMLQFKGAKSSAHIAEVQVLPANGAKLYTEYLTNKKIFFDENIKPSDNTYYTIVLYDGGYRTLWDLRGN